MTDSGSIQERARSPLGRILALFWRSHRGAFVLGLLATLAALLAGVALLGLSGWFITACAVAGAAGIGVGFDFLRPGAAVRLLSIARTGSRYAERLTTHEATLRFLAALRGRLFRGLAARPLDTAGGLRRAAALHRLTGDVDALDAIYLHLVAPLTGAAGALLLAAATLAWLVDPWAALWVVAIHLAAAAAIVGVCARQGDRPARRRAMALEALRLRLVDLMRGAAPLAVAGRLADQVDSVAAANDRAAEASRALERLERLAALIGNLASALAAGGALLIGQALGLPAAQVAIAVFVAIALTEAIAPLARGALDLGRARLAARRVAGDLAAAPPSSVPHRAAAPSERPTLTFEAVSYRRGTDRSWALDGFSLAVSAGEWVALTGPSGAGKSTVLALAARVLRPESGAIALDGAPLDAWPEAALRRRLALLPQRSELFAGTIAENLRLAAPDASDADLTEALEQVALLDVVSDRGGLGMRLGESGAGLSGGEQRRLALARLLLRRPGVVLLDEPTEGLDPETAARVLTGLRRALGDAAVLVASHRNEEILIADRAVTLGRAKMANLETRIRSAD